MKKILFILLVIILLAVIVYQILNSQNPSVKDYTTVEHDEIFALHQGSGAKLNNTDFVIISERVYKCVGDCVPGPSRYSASNDGSKTWQVFTFNNKKAELFGKIIYTLTDTNLTRRAEFYDIMLIANPGSNARPIRIMHYNPYQPLSLKEIIGKNFEYNFTVEGLEPPYIWKLITTDLPEGITFTSNSETAKLSGIPQTTGFYDIELEVVDNLGNVDSTILKLDFDREHYVIIQFGKEFTLYSGQEALINNSGGIKLSLTGFVLNRTAPNPYEEVLYCTFKLTGLRQGQLFTEDFNLSLGEKKQVDNYIIELLDYYNYGEPVTLRVAKL